MRRPPAAALAVLALVAALFAVRALAADPDVLWKIVHDRCVPNQQQHADPAPCALVDLAGGEARGHAVLKDINGATQFLLIPTARVTGIEDKVVLAPDAPNYFAAAWAARPRVEALLGRPLPRDGVSLALNAPTGRTQNQLHIHVDCLAQGVRAALREQAAAIGAHWAPLPKPLAGHPYRAVRVAGADLAGIDPFRLLADSLPGGPAAMASHTLVVVGATLPDGQDGFVLLDDQANPATADFASGEELQDHSCHGY